MGSLAECIRVVAPLFNLVLVVIVIILFLKLFKIHNPKRYTKPWGLLFGAVLLFVIEELFTVFRHLEVFELPLFMNGIFEIGIVGLFVFAVLEQMEHINRNYQK
jgi:hypothetical protein